MIADCGEIKEGEDDGVPVPSDGDVYEDYTGIKFTSIYLLTSFIFTSFYYVLFLYFCFFVGDDSLCKNEDDYAAAADKIKGYGNEYFKKGDFNAAYDKYEKV